MDSREKKSHGRSMAGLQGVHSYEEERGMLGVPHSTMTKSLSTPSIPAATRAAAVGKAAVRLCMCVGNNACAQCARVCVCVLLRVILRV